MSLGEISTNETSTVYGMSVTHNGTSSNVTITPLLSSSDPEDRAEIIQAIVDLFDSSVDFTFSNAGESLNSFREITPTP